MCVMEATDPETCCLASTVLSAHPSALGAIQDAVNAQKCCGCVAQEWRRIQGEKLGLGQETCQAKANVAVHGHLRHQSGGDAVPLPAKPVRSHLHNDAASALVRLIKAREVELVQDHRRTQRLRVCVLRRPADRQCNRLGTVLDGRFDQGSRQTNIAGLEYWRIVQLQKLQHMPPFSRVSLSLGGATKQECFSKHPFWSSACMTTARRFASTT